MFRFLSFRSVRVVLSSEFTDRYVSFFSLFSICIHFFFHHTPIKSTWTESHAEAESIFYTLFLLNVEQREMKTNNTNCEWNEVNASETHNFFVWIVFRGTLLTNSSYNSIIESKYMNYIFNWSECEIAHTIIQ